MSPLIPEWFVAPFAIAVVFVNPGLALLVAALGDAPPAVRATLLSDMVVAALTALPCMLVRARRGSSAHPPEADQ